MAFSFSIESDAATQADGRRYVRESHFVDALQFALIEYLASVGADTTAIAAAREPVLIASSADVEATNTVDLDKQPAPIFQTKAELLARIRARYLISSKSETCIIAKWFVDRLNDGSITVVECRTAWGGINAAVWSGINGRMDTYSAAIISVNSAVGE